MTDGTTSDGWGPQVFKALVTQGQAFSLTPVITAVGVTQGALVPYSGSGGQNKAYYTIDLSPFLAQSPSATVRIKLTDGSPENGWGPGIYRMIVFDGTLGIRTDGASMAGLEPTGGLPANAYPNGANIVRREYALDNSKTLQSIGLPTLVESLGTKLYLMAATLESSGTKVQIARNPDGTVGTKRSQMLGNARQLREDVANMKDNARDLIADGSSQALIAAEEARARNAQSQRARDTDSTSEVPQMLPGGGKRTRSR